MRSRERSLHVVADDLSGAAEAAGVLHQAGFRVAVRLSPGESSHEATVFDLHLRNAGSGASALIRDSIRRERAIDYVKIDSQLRGPVAELVEAAARFSVVVLAPALPRLRRTVHEGTLLIDGVPLSHSPHSAWRMEATRPPQSLSDVVPETLLLRRFPVEAVRSGVFAEALRRGRPGEVFLPDSHSAEDLGLIATAIRDAHGTMTPIGSAGLLEALVSAHSPLAGPPPMRGLAADQAVAVLGSMEPLVARQHAALGEDVTTILIRPGQDEASAGAHISAALALAPKTVVVAAEAADGPHDVSVARLLGSATAYAVRHDPAIALALVGGETARCTLQSLGVTSLVVLGEVHPGAVVCVTPDGRRVITRPGSFGGIDSLNQITTTLLGGGPQDRQEEGNQ